MNYLRKYLSTNLQLRSVHEKIFNWGPMPIDHLAHRTFKNEQICIANFKFTIEEVSNTKIEMISLKLTTDDSL